MANEDDKHFGSKRTVILDESGDSAHDKQTRIMGAQPARPGGQSRLPPTQIHEPGAPPPPGPQAAGQGFGPPPTVPSAHRDTVIGNQVPGQPPTTSPGGMQPHTQILDYATPGAAAAGPLPGVPGGAPAPGPGGGVASMANAVVGWLVVVGGPGKGQFRPVFVGNNSIGRDAGQRVPLDFGDGSISGTEQCFVRYDHDDRSFTFVPNMSKTNIVTVNNEKPMVPVPLNPLDEIGIGVTKLKFVPFCGPDFDWADTEGQ